MKITQSNLEKFILKFKAKVRGGRGPMRGKLYRMRTEGVNRVMWTNEHGYLWAYTGCGAYAASASSRPVFKSIATGHEEWLPWEWMEEAGE